MNPLTWLSPSRWLLLIGAVLALLAAYAAWSYHERALGRAQEQAAQLARDLTAERDARAEDNRIHQAQKEALHEYTEEVSRLLGDAAAASAAGERLRVQYAAALRRAAACHSPADAGGPPAGATADLLADVQRRLDEAADGIARYADQSRAAGQLCQREYDALKPQP